MKKVRQMACSDEGGCVRDSPDDTAPYSALPSALCALGGLLSPAGNTRVNEVLYMKMT